MFEEWESGFCCFFFFYKASPFDHHSRGRCWSALSEWRKGGEGGAGAAGKTEERGDSLSALHTSHMSRRERFMARFGDDNLLRQRNS